MVLTLIVAYQEAFSHSLVDLNGVRRRKIVQGLQKEEIDGTDGGGGGGWGRAEYLHRQSFNHSRCT